MVALWWLFCSKIHYYTHIRSLLHLQMHTSAIFHRILEWLTLERTSGDQVVQQPLLKQWHLEPVAQGHIQTAFKYLQGWRPQFFRQDVSVISHSHSKKVSWCSERTSWVSVCAHCLLLKLLKTQTPSENEPDAHSLQTAMRRNIAGQAVPASEQSLCLAVLFSQS